VTAPFHPAVSAARLDSIEQLRRQSWLEIPIRRTFHEGSSMPACRSGFSQHSAQGLNR
jgi:hypothetical protein